ncbi:L,D-transpeptidase [Actinomadura harenae]|uniref:Murein L,D-transpeptidase n=1 Tax=Actinomadura harenae TaxID=2483351 RepID=A0A3M2MCY7_9ACTN|nr:L,D-transpeptidase [Actinomadura harenae]RMI47371.1 murein L,D-transpeptidase [Actinomadura harenae]
MNRRAVRSGVLPLAAALLLGGCGGQGGGHAGAASGPGGKGADAPEATTFATLPGAQADPAPDADTSGLVVHPDAARPVLDRPGGKPVAVLPPTELSGPTWVPAVQADGDWLRVLLPSRPNGATGWITTRGGGLRTAHTPYVIRVDVTHRALTLLKDGKQVGRWTVAVGGPSTPTPPGRTFVMASLAPAKRTPSPVVLPLGTHSATLDSFGGGPGTVALHGWPDASVFGKPVTHGCVRVPPDALRQLSGVPLGTLVHLT